MQVYQAIAQALRILADDASPEHIRTIAENALERVAEALPSGSGFDCGTKVDDLINARAYALTFDYHHMDDMGGYCGWTSHTATIEPDWFDYSVTITGDSLADYGDDMTEEYFIDTLRGALSADFDWIAQR